ncbi:hypothetical protein MN608_10631 [Microdochium nivale]|nr:hypothetical protein MN608_10631 [Microdochium nivale]
MTHMSFYSDSFVTGAAAIEKAWRLAAGAKSPPPGTSGTKRNMKPLKVKHFLPKSSTCAPPQLSLGIISDSEILSRRIEDDTDSVAVAREDVENNANNHNHKGDDGSINICAEGAHCDIRLQHPDIIGNDDGIISSFVPPLTGSRLPGFSHGRYCYCTICTELGAGEYRRNESMPAPSTSSSWRGEDTREDIFLETHPEEPREQTARQHQGGRTSQPQASRNSHAAAGERGATAGAATGPNSTFTTTSSPSTAATSHSSTHEDDSSHGAVSDEAVDFNAAHAHLRHEQQRQSRPQPQFEFCSDFYPGASRSELARAAQVVGHAYLHDREGMPVDDDLLFLMTPNHPSLRQSRAGIIPYFEGGDTYYTTPWEQWEQKRRQEGGAAAADGDSAVDCEGQDQDADLSRASKRGLWRWENKLDTTFVPYWNEEAPTGNVENWSDFVEEHGGATF